MVSAASYRIIKKAVVLRVSQGENLEEVVASYNKLSDAQKEQLISELTSEE